MFVSHRFSNKLIIKNFVTTVKFQKQKRINKRITYHVNSVPDTVLNVNKIEVHTKKNNTKTQGCKIWQLQSKASIDRKDYRADVKHVHTARGRFFNKNNPKVEQLKRRRINKG